MMARKVTTLLIACSRIIRIAASNLNCGAIVSLSRGWKLRGMAWRNLEINIKGCSHVDHDGHLVAHHSDFFPFCTFVWLFSNFVVDGMRVIGH